MSEETKNETPSGVNDGMAYIGDDSFVIDCITVIGQVEGHYSLPQGQKARQIQSLCGNGQCPGTANLGKLSGNGYGPLHGVF